jgi:hypothetical protein
MAIGLIAKPSTRAEKILSQRSAQQKARPRSPLPGAIQRIPFRQLRQLQEGCKNHFMRFAHRFDFT